MAAESPRMRIGRMFGLGKYGYELADEILLQFQMDIERELTHNGHERAAEYLIDRRSPCIGQLTLGLDGTEEVPLPE